MIAVTKLKIKRIYHHYLNCEEYKSNMWLVLPKIEREQAILESAELMIDSERFEAACFRVIGSWPNSCEANLSATVINHQAWIGHAACALNHGSSEDLTRTAWRTLSVDQQSAANNAADQAINHWKAKYLEGAKNA